MFEDFEPEEEWSEEDKRDLRADIAHDKRKEEKYMRQETEWREEPSPDWYRK